jgi:Ni/Co efflux regulator RcnB
MTTLKHRSNLSTKVLGLAIAVTLAGAGGAFAQPHGHDDHNNGGHPGWGQDFGGGGGHQFKKGDRMGYNDWHSAPAVDYRSHHLRSPPRGYEWREVNGQYVLAAVATGLIASIILSAGH